MPIGEQNPITPHTGNGIATVFAYDFAILSADDIKVKVGGVPVTTGFTVAGIGDRDGGTVAFSVPPGSDVEVLLYRKVTRARATDYQYNGDLREDVLDDDLDRVWMALQEDAELVGRGIRVPVGESLSELPGASLRGDKVLTFDASGAIVLVDVEAFSGGGVVELVPGDGSVTSVKLDAALLALVNGALQKSGGDMAGLFKLFGNASDLLHPVPLQQAQALIAAALQGVPGRNKIINGVFSINQRAFAGGALSSGVYGHDRWKAGSGGATYTVAGETATITAGTLVQVIEGLNVHDGGTFTLSWSGTAQARIDGGSYAASPITVTGKTAGANTAIEFGTGTVTKVQYEAGVSPTAFERRLFDQEVAACQRYMFVLEHALTLRGYGAGGGAQTFMNVPFPVRMRASPTITTSFSSGANNSAQGIASQGADGFSLYVNSSGAGDFAVTYVSGNTAVAEL